MAGSLPGHAVVRGRRTVGRYYGVSSAALSLPVYLWIISWLFGYGNKARFNTAQVFYLAFRGSKTVAAAEVAPVRSDMVAPHRGFVYGGYRAYRIEPADSECVGPRVVSDPGGIPLQRLDLV